MQNGCTMKQAQCLFAFCVDPATGDNNRVEMISLLAKISNTLIVRFALNYLRYCNKPVASEADAKDFIAWVQLLYKLHKPVLAQ